MKIRLNREKLRDLRLELNMTQLYLAESTDTSERYIRALESGAKNKPTAEVLCRIAMTLDTPMEELMMVVPDDEP